MNGSGYVKYSALKESKFSSDYRYPYVIQGATAFGGAYYFAATYNNSNALIPNAEMPSTTAQPTAIAAYKPYGVFFLRLLALLMEAI